MADDKNYKEAGFLISFFRNHHPDRKTLEPSYFFKAFKSKEFNALLNVEHARNVWMYFNAAAVFSNEDWKPYPEMKEIIQFYLKWSEHLDPDLMKIRESLLKIQSQL